MKLTSIEHDALCEIANIGLSRAATQLSALLNDQIEISTPSVIITTSETIPEAIQLNEQSNVIAVGQHFAGSIKGAALLLFPLGDSQDILLKLIGASDQELSSIDLRGFEHEAITEIGNIIISSGITAIADMLRQEFILSTPNYAEGYLLDVIAKYNQLDPALQPNFLVIFTRLHAMQRLIDGRLILLMPIKSIQALRIRLHELLQNNR